MTLRYRTLVLGLVLSTACGDGSTGTSAVLTSVIVSGASGGSATLKNLQTLQLTAQPKDQNGNAIDAAVNWQSTNPSVATVKSGLVTAVSSGTTSILATVTKGGATVSATTAVTVLLSPAGTWAGITGTQFLTITLSESNGVVTGFGSLTNTPTGTRVQSSTGTFAGETLAITLTSPPSPAIQLHATVSDGSLVGSLTGSNFTGQVITLSRLQ